MPLIYKSPLLPSGGLILSIFHNVSQNFPSDSLLVAYCGHWLPFPMSFPPLSTSVLCASQISACTPVLVTGSVLGIQAEQSGGIASS